MRRTTRRVWEPLILAVAVGTSGASLRAADGDELIESAFKATYVYRAYLIDDALRARARDGVVTLTGTVAEESHKSLAQETAAGLSGVTRVDNQLATAETATGADAVIGRKVSLALKLHRATLGSQTRVEVRDGVVTLSGMASSTAQKDLTAEYVDDIEGVQEVRNTMTVATVLEPATPGKRETLDDASITAQVVTALMTHRSTRSVITRVATRNGEVTLTGITKNAAQNALIAKLVTDINGVKGVKNKMTIESEPRSD